ncbi:FAD-dependent oxidoreductase [bacterium]|nr:FAD-dependent oxidoreductase [bacterium]
MKKLDFDYIIIGGGLAGTILADFLSKKASVLVFDKEAGKYGSKVAAGIYNPVTGRRMVKSWNVDTFAPFAKAYYQAIEEQTGQHLLDEIDIQRLFHNEQQREEWLKKVDFFHLEEIITGEILPDAENPQWHKEFGGVSTTSSWRLDTAAFLDLMHQRMLQNGSLHQTQVAYNDVVVSPDLVQVKDYKAARLIFCEGWNIAKNPWFGYLPMRPNKGELLTIEAPGLVVDDLVQKGIFVLPVAENTFKVGATYNRQNPDYQATDEAKTWLTQRLEKIIKVPYQIINHEAGVRPASYDRRPFVGQHPQLERLFIFNGFGSKGVHQMPWSAQHFVEVLESGETLNEEMDIKRALDFVEKNS